MIIRPKTPKIAAKINVVAPEWCLTSNLFRHLKSVLTPKAAYSENPILY